MLKGARERINREGVRIILFFLRAAAAEQNLFFNLYYGEILLQAVVITRTGGKLRIIGLATGPSLRPEAKYTHEERLLEIRD